MVCPKFADYSPYFLMTCRTVGSSIAIGVIIMWAEGFNSVISNQMCDVMSGFLAKNLNTRSAFLWSFYVSCQRPSILTGTIISSHLIDKFGRKRTMEACSIPCIVGLFLQMLSFLDLLDSVSVLPSLMLFFGRFIVGFSAGTSVVACGVFLSETSTKDNRGTRTGSIMTQYTFSSLVASILCLDSVMGTIKLWNYIYLVPTAALILSFLIVLRCPETPIFLNRQCKPNKDVDRSLKFYIPIAEPTEQEILNLRLELDSSRKISIVPQSCFQKLKMLLEPKLRVSCIVSLALAIGYANGGAFLICSYSTMILESLGMPSLEAKKYTVALVSVNLIAAICGNFFISYFGRRNVVLISTFCCAFLQFSLGVLCWMTDGNNPKYYQCVIVAVLMTACSSFGYAYTCAYHVLIPELFPFRTRSTARAVAGVIDDVCTFTSIFLFYPIYRKSQVGAFALVFVPTLVCGIVLFLFCPESKGKETREILEHIGDRFQKIRKHSGVKRAEGALGVRSTWMGHGDNKSLHF